MDTDNQENNNTEDEAKVSEEEKKAEAEALTEVKDEELRAKTAEDLGVDPEDEPELLDKVVEMRKVERAKTSGAIKQKISWRDKANKASEKPKKKSEGDNTQTDDTVKPLTEEEFDKRLDERDAKRDLKDLDLSEEVEKEVEDLAKVKGISIREAAEHPYIVSTMEEAKKAERVKDATPSRKNKGSYSSNVDASKPLDPADFELDTKKGRKSWTEAKAARRQYESENK